VLGVQAGGDLGEDQVLGGPAGIGAVGQHLPGRVQPARVRPGQRPPSASPAVVGQPGRAVVPEVLDPAAQGGHPDPDLGGLGGIAVQHRDTGSVLRARLAGRRQLGASAPEPRPHFLDVRDALAQLRQFGLAQPGQLRAGAPGGGGGRPSSRVDGSASRCPALTRRTPEAPDSRT
jgi:hypothetical protein